MNSIFKATLLSVLISVAVNAAPPAGRSQTGATKPNDERSMNLRVNPLGLLYGSLSADFDIKVSDTITIGPTLSYLKAGWLFTSLSGVGIGVRGNIYLSGDAMTDSWYIGPSLGINMMSVDLLGTKGGATSFYVGSTVGYQWVWPSGLNINLAAGANWYSNGGTVLADNGSTTLDVPFYHGIQPAGEVTVGWAF